jgi:hypothetical protein
LLRRLESQGLLRSEWRALFAVGAALALSIAIDLVRIARR